MSKKLSYAHYTETAKTKRSISAPYNPSSSPKNIRPITFSFQFSTYGWYSKAQRSMMALASSKPKSQVFLYLVPS